MKKKMVLIALCFLSLLSCTKSTSDNKADDPYKDVPNTMVPQHLAHGIWFSGTLSAISYFDRDGHQLGNDYEAGREYQFYNENGKGRIKFWQYLGTRGYSSCNTTEIYTYKEGSVVFSENKFIFYPVKGKFKTVKKTCSSGTNVSEVAATADQLEPVVFLWEMREVNGEPCLYTFAENDTEHETPLFVYSFTE